MLVSEYCRNTREILSPLKSSCPGSVLQDNPGHATRTRKGRRPQLSESEDGDCVGGGGAGWAACTLPRPRPAPSSGQEASVGRSVSVPPRLPVTSLPRHKVGPLSLCCQFAMSDVQEATHYWGLAFPLDPRVLQPRPRPRPPAAGAPAPPPLPLQLAALYTSSVQRHQPRSCLACCTQLRDTARPRASSLTAAPAAASCPAAEARRGSCFSLGVYREGGEARAEAATEQRSPTDRKEAASEALALISSLNNPIKVRRGIF